ncbi:MAG: DoxX family protein [Desulfitobacterium hafniense]|nr:DoxX family protein [Desulfitobacterium hafniense]
MGQLVNFLSFTNGYFDGVLVLVRIIAALVFGSHGWFKSYGKQKFYGSAKRFAEHGIPFPLFFSYVTSISQLVAVPLLLLGLFTRWISLLLAVEMIVATWAKYKETNSIFDGADLPLSDFAICLLLMVLGPGAYSIDVLF